MAASGSALAKLPRIIESVERVIFGKRDAVTLATIGLLAGGHVLIEDAPGTGKTTLARALAQSVGLSFRRIQFTSDLLPADVLGVSVHDSARGEFVFQRGPIFGHVVLADELNRTSPRTQSALLECMAEGRVTVDGETYTLPQPFFVIATQNPLEFEGTYPLPESQLDRFVLRVRMGYPDRDAERRVLLDHAGTDLLASVQSVMTEDEVSAAREAVLAIRMDDSLVEYVLDLLAATRDDGRFLVGLSPRAGLALRRTAQANAALDGRDYCVPDDVKRVAVSVLAHRVVPRQVRGTDGRDAEALIHEVLETTRVPS